MSNGSQCGLCGFSGERSFVSETDSKTGKALSVVLCPACGFVQQAAMPTAEELTVYYSHNYRLDYKSSYKPKLKHVDRAGKAAVKRLERLASHGLIQPQRTLLDIGAGGGEFVFLAKRAGLDATGVEPNQGYSEFAKSHYGVSIQTAMIDDVATGSADMVTLFHVLEHIADPARMMRRLWEILNPGGHLLIEVPNILQADASPHNIFFLAHLHYFSRYTLVAFASRYFDVIEVQDSGNLMVLFRRRETVLRDLSLPTDEQVERIKQRLHQKGWMEYLFFGGGLIKPFAKTGSRLRELCLRGDARSLLERRFADSRIRQLNEINGSDAR